jgi:hypothetical protein
MLFQIEKEAKKDKIVCLEGINSFCGELFDIVIDVSVKNNLKKGISLDDFIKKYNENQLFKMNYEEGAPKQKKQTYNTQSFSQFSQ